MTCTGWSHTRWTCVHICRSTYGEERKVVTTKGNAGGHLEFKKQEINHFRPRLSFHTRFELRLVENAKHPDSSQRALEHTSHCATVQRIHWEQFQQTTAAPHHRTPQLCNKETLVVVNISRSLDCMKALWSCLTLNADIPLVLMLPLPAGLAKRRRPRPSSCEQVSNQVSVLLPNLNIFYNTVSVTYSINTLDWNANERLCDCLYTVSWCTWNTAAELQ